MQPMPGPRKKKVPGPDGTPVEGTVVPFQTVVENFNEYLLDDGAVMRVKTVLADVVRLDGVYDAEGQPVYMMNYQQVVNLSVPDELRKKEE